MGQLADEAKTGFVHMITSARAFPSVKTQKNYLDCVSSIFLSLPPKKVPLIMAADNSQLLALLLFPP